MSQAAAQAAAFYREVARTGLVWTIRDDDGFPAPATTAGRAQPFWSSRARARTCVSSVPAFQGFQVVEVSLDEFLAKWLPGLAADGISVGVNWTGRRATGFDVPASTVAEAIDFARGLVD